MTTDFINLNAVLPVYPHPMIKNPRLRKLNDDLDPEVGLAERRFEGFPYLNVLDERIYALEASGVRNILIVSPDINTARKAFRYYMNIADSYVMTGKVTSTNGRPLALGNGCFDMQNMCFEITRDNSPLYEISLRTVREKNQLVENQYLAGVAGHLKPEMDYLYVGLEDGCDIEEKLETIRALYNGGRKFVWITPEQLSQPFVMQLKLVERFEELKVESPSDDHYCSFLEDILNRTGMSFEDGLTPRDVLLTIKTKLGKLLDETTLDVMTQEAARRALIRISAQKKEKAPGRGRRKKEKIKIVLKLTDFIPDYDPDNSALKQLNRMTGLKEAKRMVREVAAYLKEKARNPKLSEADMHNNMIFQGNPGVGKTTVAELCARAFAEAGGKNGVFVNASRSDLIGKYVGHTAAQIAKEFKEARGGVLFIDEAGFFVNREAGGFVDEGLKELVRYMETMPDVTVIFAMYSREVEDFLALDEGLRSRISRVVKFEDYNDDELIEIAGRMCQDKGYVLDEASYSLITDYISELRDKDDFGNARDIRRLVNNAVLAHAMALHDKEQEKPSCVPDPDVISHSEIAEAIGMSENDIADNKHLHRIGFAMEAADDGDVLWRSAV